MPQDLTFAKPRIFKKCFFGGGDHPARLAGSDRTGGSHEQYVSSFRSCIHASNVFSLYIRDHYNEEEHTMKRVKYPLKVSSQASVYSRYHAIQSKRIIPKNTQ